MRKWVSFPLKEGDVSRQAHADFPEQAIYEREVGRSGFFGPATHLHHTHAPTGWSDWQGPLRPRLFNFNNIGEDQANSPWSVPDLLHNAHCKMRTWRLTAPMDYLVRNADGDDLLFIHEGSAELYCDYGHLSLRDGDYVVIPRSTMWRLVPNEPLFVLMIASEFLR